MKIAVSSSASNMESTLDPRFGRCPFFLIVDSENMNFEAIDNQAIAQGGGAGVRAAQNILSKGVKSVITGKCGPKVIQLLSDAGVDVYTGQTGTVRDIIESYLNGNLTAATKANRILLSDTGTHGHSHGHCRCRIKHLSTEKGTNNEPCRNNVH